MAELFSNRGELGGLAKSERAKEREREWTGRGDAMCPFLMRDLSLSQRSLNPTSFCHLFKNFTFIHTAKVKNQPTALVIVPVRTSSSNPTKIKMKET